MACLEPFRGSVWTLRRALSISKKDRLTVSDLAALVEGSGRCTAHGVEMMAGGSSRSDMARVLEALAETSTMLLDKARVHMSQADPGCWEDLGDDLARKMARVENETVFLSHWARHLNARGRLSTSGCLRQAYYERDTCRCPFPPKFN